MVTEVDTVSESVSRVISLNAISSFLTLTFFMFPDGFCVGKCPICAPEDSGQWRYDGDCFFLDIYRFILL